jgi:vacuolar-type H+-ATPase subunit I/STV1
MPEEAILAPTTEAPVQSVADTPTNDPADLGGQVTDNPTPEDAEQGYLRHSDYTRKTQELAQQRQEWEAKQAEAEQFRELVETALVNQDEEAAQQLLENLGYEFGDDDADGPADPAVAGLQKELAELKEWKNEQQEQADARENAFHIEREFNRLGLNSWDDQNPMHNAVLSMAFAHDDGQSPLNVEAGFKDYQALREWVIEDHKQSKLTASNDPTGSPVSAAPTDNATLEERVALAMERNGL